MRLIDADKLITAIKEEAVVIDINAKIKRVVVRGEEFLPVIRCKDCKFSSPNGVYGCRIHSFADDLDKRMYSDDFCSMAERKE